MSDKFEVGDVIKYEGATYVIADMKNHERCGDCSYNREYLLCYEKDMHDYCGEVKKRDLEVNGFWLQVTGIDFPAFKKVKGIAPYEITTVEYVNIRQKKVKVKTIKVFE